MFSDKSGVNSSPCMRLIHLFLSDTYESAGTNPMHYFGVAVVELS